MKSAKNELKQFVAGVVMLIVGLFILSQKVVVSSGWFGYGGTIMLGGVRLNSGMIMIPFIIGIIWMFASGNVSVLHSLASKHTGMPCTAPI